VLEGTGSLVFDNKNKTIFLSQSSRGSLSALDPFMKTFDKVQPGFRVLCFSALDQSGNQVYHTNVVLSVLDHHLLCCLDSIQEHTSCEKEKSVEAKQIHRDEIAEWASECGKALVNLSHEEMNNFCGNIIQLRNKKGESVVVMSERARRSYKNPTWMESYSHIVSADITTIENIGGGLID